MTPVHRRETQSRVKNHAHDVYLNPAVVTSSHLLDLPLNQADNLCKYRSKDRIDLIPNIVKDIPIAPYDDSLRYPYERPISGNSGAPGIGISNSSSHSAASGLNWLLIVVSKLRIASERLRGVRTSLALAPNFCRINCSKASLRYSAPQAPPVPRTHSLTMNGRRDLTTYEIKS